MSTNIGLMELPDTEDLKNISEKICDGMSLLVDFLSTHPTPLKVATSVQNIFGFIR